MSKSAAVKFAGALAAVAVLATGCSGSTSGHAMSGGRASGGNGAMASTSATRAAALRSGLNALLKEHVCLAAAATNAALGGRQAEFQAAAGALDANSVDVAKAIGSVYSVDAQNAFLPLWRRHIGFVVDYTVGVATGDRGKQDRAVGELIG